MKQFFTLSLLFIVNLSMAQTNSTTLNYATDKSDLTAEQLDQLEQFVSVINYDKVGLINIYGHTDTVASKAYNVALSLKRASKVEAFFLSKGFESSLIKKDWFGENLANSPGNLLEDRRVVIELFYQKEEPPKPFIPDPKPKEPEIIIPDLSAFYPLIKDPIQEFCIPFNKDTLLKGAKGTIIQIKAGSFKLTEAQRESASCITFQLREAFLKSDMVLENLSTMSNDRILETQGMTYTNAMVGEDTLSLIKDIAILLPTDTIMPGLEVFDGARDPHTDVMNWAVNNNSSLRNFNVIDLKNCMQLAQVLNDSLGDFREICGYCQNCDTRLWIDLDELRRACYLKQCRVIDRSICRNCKKCKLFFCKIGRLPRTIQGAFNEEVRQENYYFRFCQLSYKRKFRWSKNRKKFNRDQLVEEGLEAIRRKALKGKSKLTKREKEILEIADIIEKTDDFIKHKGHLIEKEMTPCSKLDSLFSTYGVSNKEDLLVALNKPLMEEFGVSTMQELLDTLPKSNLDELEVAYKNKRISYGDYKFYIFSASTLGWKNLDVFAKIPKENLVKVNIPIPPSKHADFKLVFTNREFVISAKPGLQSYYFENMPKGETAWIVGIQYIDGKPMLAMQSVVVDQKEFNVDFKELSLEELKEQLKILDFKGNS